MWWAVIIAKDSLLVLAWLRLEDRDYLDVLAVRNSPTQLRHRIDPRRRHSSLILQLFAEDVCQHDACGSLLGSSLHSWVRFEAGFRGCNSYEKLLLAFLEVLYLLHVILEVFGKHFRARHLLTLGHWALSPSAVYICFYEIYDLLVLFCVVLCCTQLCVQRYLVHVWH